MDEQEKYTRKSNEIEEEEKGELENGERVKTLRRKIIRGGTKAEKVTESRSGRNKRHETKKNKRECQGRKKQLDRGIRKV